MPDDAYKAINDVRARVKMPSIPKGLDPEELRARIRNERRIEFAFENHRFYDVRRWKILDETAVVTGMIPVDETITEEPILDEDGNPELDDEGNVKTMEVRKCESYQRISVGKSAAVADKFLRLPVPIAEAVNLKSHTGLEFQNPGWGK